MAIIEQVTFIVAITALIIVNLLFIINVVKLGLYSENILSKVALLFTGIFTLSLGVFIILEENSIVITPCVFGLVRCCDKLLYSFLL